MSYDYRPAKRRGMQSRYKTNDNRPKRGGNKKDYIDPSRFIKAAKQVEAVTYEPTHQFADFAVDPQLTANIAAKGFVVPSPIQDQTIPLGLDGHDVIGIANTGTGKTAAFSIPLLHRLMTDPQARALIMAPTRELAQQIEAECRSIAKGSGLRGALLIGGTAMGPQLRDLKTGPQIIIGTPGRIKDHMERGSFQSEQFNIVVLDEVDRMLDMGFIGDMQIILAALAKPRQSFFFSATMDRRVKDLIDSFAHEPVTVSVKTGETSDNVDQDVVHYESRNDKFQKLEIILGDLPSAKTLIFDDTQRAVERLSKELQGQGFRVDAIHGGKNQNQRQRALDRFKRNEVTVLVATDVAARGIDISDITHVINYATPKTYADYVHRIGRAGRAGRAGQALTFVGND